MAIPPGNHSDWLWPMSLIPRSWNARESNVEPRALLKSKGYVGNLDIPKPGHYAISRGEFWWELYAAITFSRIDEQGRAWHARIGVARFDYNDRYFNYLFFLPTIKRIKFQP
jgi:hypothetical protein